jgi:hypothetical protein
MMDRGKKELMMPSIAYVRRDDDGSCEVHDLEEDVRAVGDVAGEFALVFDL